MKKEPLFSLRKYAALTGRGYKNLKKDYAGGRLRLVYQGTGDIALDLKSFRKLVPQEMDFDAIAIQCRWQENTGVPSNGAKPNDKPATVPVKRAVVVFRPINTRLLLCDLEDGSLRRVSVIVSSNVLWTKGMKLYLTHHPSVPGFYQVAGPSPFRPNDFSYPVRLRKYEETIEQ